jgi:hypothetical protein
MVDLSRLYITHIEAEFDCDVHFPPWGPDWVRVTDSRVPTDIQAIEKRDHINSFLMHQILGKSVNLLIRKLNFSVCFIS